MKLGDFTGIHGIPNQDIAMWETMGPIADRTKDWLGASDIAVARFRRLMVDAAQAMRDGGPALGRTEPHIPHAEIASFEGVVPKSRRLAHVGWFDAARAADDRGGVGWPASGSSSLRGAQRRSNPERRLSAGLLRFARNDEPRDKR